MRRTNLQDAPATTAPAAEVQQVYLEPVPGAPMATVISTQDVAAACAATTGAAAAAVAPPRRGRVDDTHQAAQAASAPIMASPPRLQRDTTMLPAPPLQSTGATRPHAGNSGNTPGGKRGKQ